MTTLVCGCCKATIEVSAYGKRPWLEHRREQAEKAGWKSTAMGWCCSGCQKGGAK